MDFLVVDDDKTFLDATCFMIESEGHYAEGALSGSRALTLLKQNKFDAALLDLNLGLERGLDVLAEMLISFPNLPVAILAAESSVKIAVEAMRRGAIDFLEKPFQKEHLLTVITRLHRFSQLGQRIERLEREVKERRRQDVEPILDFASPAMREVMDTLLRAARTPPRS
jgi:NtrC-family two-component system response regulator AlgB